MACNSLQFTGVAVRSTFLLQDIVRGLCTAHDGGVLLLSAARRSNMISSQAAQSFRDNRVELTQASSLPATLHTT